MNYFSKYDYTIIRRHQIILLFKYLKSLIFLLLAGLLFFICVKYPNYLWGELVYYFIFPIIFILVNYAFIKLVLSYIKFYNDLLIISNWQLIVIKASLLFKDDIEFIDINKITKIDTYCRWIISNIIWYWVLVVEQQRDQVREFHYVPNSRKALHLIKDEKVKFIDNNKLFTKEKND